MGKIIRVTLFGAVILIAPPVVWHLYQRYTANQELRAVIDELDKRDPGWRLDEIEAAREKIPNEKNAAVIVLKAARQIPQRWGDQGIHEQLQKLPPPVRLNKRQLSQLRTQQERLKRTVIEARQLVDFSKGRYKTIWTDDFINTLLPHLDSARTVAAILEHEATLLAEEIKLDQAWKLALSIHRAGQSIGDEPSLMSQFVRMHIQRAGTKTLERILAQGQIDTVSLTQAQTILEQDAKEPLSAYGLRGERAGNFMLAQNLVNGNVSMDSVAGGKAKPSVSDHLVSVYAVPMLIRSNAWLLKHYTEGLELAELPPRTRYQRLKKNEREISQYFAKNHSLILAKLMAPPWHKIGFQGVRSETYLNCASAALACERFRLEHKRWPLSLDELAKAGFIKVAPIDPYDGKKLRYRKTKHGIIVFSIGPGENNKGDSLDNPGLEEPKMRMEFRVWNVDRRRQPPLEQKEK